MSRIPPSAKTVWGERLARPTVWRANDPRTEIYLKREPATTLGTPPAPVSRAAALGCREQLVQMQKEWEAWARQVKEMAETQMRQEAQRARDEAGKLADYVDDIQAENAQLRREVAELRARDARRAKEVERLDGILEAAQADLRRKTRECDAAADKATAQVAAFQQQIEALQSAASECDCSAEVDAAVESLQQQIKAFAGEFQKVLSSVIELRDRAQQLG